MYLDRRGTNLDGLDSVRLPVHHAGMDQSLSERICWEINLLTPVGPNHLVAHRSETEHFSGTVEEMVAHITRLHQETGYVHSGKPV